MATERGLAGLAFADPGEEQAAFADMSGAGRRPAMSRTCARTAPLARRIFDPELWRADQPLRVVLIGTDFEVRVWEALLKIPMGRATTYSDIAAKVGARRPRARSAPRSARTRSASWCRATACSARAAKLTGYHWGLTRKRAMLGWEAGGTVGVAASNTPARGRAAQSALPRSRRDRKPLFVD